MIGRICVVLGVLAAVPAAQDARVGRTERRLAEVRNQEAELRDLLDRHARGEDVSAARWLVVTDVDRQRAEAGGAESAHAAEERTAALHAELTDLETRVSAARERARREALGDSLPRPEELARLAAAAHGPTPAPPVEAPSQRLDPDAPRALIRGTADRQRIGSALLQAGADLQREAAALEGQGRTEAADAARKRARELLEAARAELEPVAQRKDAPLSALFALARCEEKLGRVAVADALYAVVADRDQAPGPDGQPVSGPFGRAARTARTVMEWLRDTADWKPRRDVDRIRWDDR